MWVQKGLTEGGRLSLTGWLHFMLYGPIQKASKETIILCILTVGKMWPATPCSSSMTSGSLSMTDWIQLNHYPNKPFLLKLFLVGYLVTSMREIINVALQFSTYTPHHPSSHASRWEKQWGHILGFVEPMSMYPLEHGSFPHIWAGTPDTSYLSIPSSYLTNA